MSALGTIHPIGSPGPRSAAGGGSVAARSAAAAAERGVAELRAVAGGVVGTVFFGTLLRNLRSSTLQGEYGHGGRGEEVFQAQLDQLLAERSGRTGRFGLADAIVDRLEGQQRAIITAQAAAGEGA